VKLAEHKKVQLPQVPGHKSTEANETANHLARVGFECPFTGPEPACSISAGAATRTGQTGTIKILTDHNRTQICKGFPTRTLCQKNLCTTGSNQKPVMVGDRTTYRTLSPGINRQFHFLMVPGKRWINLTCPMWLWGCRLCNILPHVTVLYITRCLSRCPFK
jgi:hypothetical protein